MQKKLCAVFLFVAFSVVAGYPASTKDEVEFVPLEHQGPNHNPGFGDYDYPDRYFPNPFDISGLTDGFEAMLARMRQQIAALFRHLPSKSDFPESEEGSFPGLPNLGDLGKGNTTSVTKVIDGHKVVINETDYKTEGANGGAYFKVRIIDVKPNEDESTEKPNQQSSEEKSPEEREVEPLEDSIENEIPKNKEGSIYDNLEAFDDIDYDVKPKEAELDWNDVEPLETFEDNTLTIKKPQNYHDLTNDIYVNQLLADAGAPTNPDAEFISGFERQPRVDDMGIKRRIR